MDSTREQIQALLQEASPEAQEVVAQVLRLEKEKLHLKLPRGVVEDITDVIKRLVN
jgi:hypothetical protein